MTNYPYYVLTYYSGGILTKVWDNKKFKTYTECKEALKKRLENFPVLNKYQCVILEYTEQYKSKIINVVQNGQGQLFIDPVKY